MTAMFYQFIASEGGHPTWEENFFEKISKYKVLLLVTPVNFKSVANIYLYIKYDFLSRIFIIDQS